MVRADTSEANLDGGGLTAGWHHFTILSADPVNGELVIKSVVEEGPPGSHEKEFTDYFKLAGPSSGRIVGLARACGVIDQDAVSAAKTEGGIDIPEELLPGCQYCTVLEMKPYAGKNEAHKGKLFAKTGFQFYHPLDPAAKDCPKDADKVKMLVPPEGYDAGGNGAAAPQNTPAGGEALSAGGDDDWSDVK